MNQGERSTFSSQQIYLGKLASTLDCSFAFASQSKAIFWESNQSKLVPLDKDFAKAHFI